MHPDLQTREKFSRRFNTFAAAGLLLIGLPCSLVRAAFTNVTADSGIEYIHSTVDEESRNHAGAAAVDVDGDGWTDLLVARFGKRPLLYKNQGDGSFIEEGEARGLGGAVDAAAFAAGDFDNDGDPDLYIVPHDKNRCWLYINDGTGHFVEEAVARGADLTTSLHNHEGYSVGLVDYDLDGYLDIYISEWGVASSAENHLHSALLRNRGADAPGHFEVATEAAGLVQPLGDSSLQYGFSSAWGDFDGDGWPDLALIADFGHSKMYWNDGDGTFTESVDASGMGKEENGMGVAVGDFDRDGLLDLYVTSIYDKVVFDKNGSYTGNKLYRNLGDRVFAEVASEVGVSRTGWGWGTAFFEYNNNGYPDLIATNGYPAGSGGDPATTPLAAAATDPTTLFRNNGGTFTRLGANSGIVDADFGKAIVVLDFDNDGDEDLFIANTLTQPILYRSDASENGNKWIRLKFRGVTSNRDGNGAIVTARSGDHSQVALYNPTNAYIGQRENVLHFGLGAAGSTLDHLLIVWPSGIRQEITDLATNQTHTIVEPESSITLPSIDAQPQGGVFERGQPLSLTVTAIGDPAPVYVWEKDGETIEGASGPTYSISRASPIDTGSYRARAINSAGSALSEAVDVVITIDLDGRSVARWWNEFLTDAVRRDFPFPPFVARNYYHASAAMWDAFWAYEEDGWSSAVPVASAEQVEPASWVGGREAAQEAAISHAVYTVLRSRYANAAGAERSLAEFRWLMEQYGLDADDIGTEGDSPSAVGNRIGAAILALAASDGSGEAEGFPDVSGYEPANPPLNYGQRGTEMNDPSRWQPLNLQVSVTKNGIVIGEELQQFLAPSWGWVAPFSFEQAVQPNILIDPGPPPQFGEETHELFAQEAVEVIRYSSWVDPYSDELIDISIGSYLNNRYGTRDARGRAINPVTEQPYPENWVKRGDLVRMAAEFWSDGPGVEGPPGVWNMMHNEVSDHPLFERRFGGTGEALSKLEWDVHAYLAINGALHDAAIATWGIKRKYDSARPISIIRYLGALGQSSDPAGPSYHEHGLPLVENLIELVTEESAELGQRHEHLAGSIGAVAVKAWRGTSGNATRTPKGVGWILAEDWTPYHLDTFPTPNFAGYVSGHTVFSRTAAEVMALLTGSPFFPGGEWTYSFGKNSYLRVEEGPSEDFTMSCATYYDAADITGLARLFCGVHVTADDLPARAVGTQVGVSAFLKVNTLRNGIADTMLPTLASAAYGLEPGRGASWARFDSENSQGLPALFELSPNAGGTLLGPAIRTTISEEGEAVSRYEGVPLHRFETRGPVGAGRHLVLEFELSQTSGPLVGLAAATLEDSIESSLLLYRKDGDDWTLLERSVDWMDGESASLVALLSEQLDLGVPHGAPAIHLALAAGRYRVELVSDEAAMHGPTLRVAFLAD